MGWRVAAGWQQGGREDKPVEQASFPSPVKLDVAQAVFFGADMLQEGIELDQ